MLQPRPQEAKESRKRLGFVTSAFLPKGDQTSSFDFFAILTSQVLLRLQRTYDVVVRVPDPTQPSIARSQQQLLSELLKADSSFYGYIVSPFDVQEIAPLVIEFGKKNSPAWLITIDQSLESSGLFRRHGVEVPRAVVPDNYQGGERAARALWEYYRSFPGEQRELGKPRFIVVEGSGASPIRREAFTEYIKEWSKGRAIVETSGPLLFSRGDGLEWVRTQLDHDIDAWKDVVGIFACNDELALGVCDALDSHLLNNPSGEHLIKAAVVGFDGIRDVVGRLRKDDELWLLNTVKIPIGAMAGKLEQIVDELSSDRCRPRLDRTIETVPMLSKVWRYVTERLMDRHGESVELMECELAEECEKQTSFTAFRTRRRKWAKAFGIKLRTEVVAITVKEEEEKALLALIGTTDPYEGTNRTYNIGRINRVDNTPLRIAVVRAVEQGVGAAQNIARDAIEDLNLGAIALVGIAGAKPATEYGLGDVIVCTRLHDLTMGAYIWDAREKVSKELFSNLGGPMATRVQHLIGSFGGIAEQLDGWKSESLVGSQPEFCLNEKKIDAVVDDRYRDKLKESIRARFDERKSPTFYAGSIATDGYLVKDPEVLKKWLAVVKDLVAIDMELPGVYVAARRKDNEFPILAIRGISDVVGLDREPVWTEYACKTAASFFVHLLHVHPGLGRDSTFYVRR